MGLKNTIKFKMSAESVWLYETKKERPWYGKGGSGVLALFLLAAIDAAGFIQGVISNTTLFENMTEKDEWIGYMMSGIMVCAFVAAFEGSTIYMAYAFNLKLYNYDRYAIKKITEKSKKGAISKFVSTSTLGWLS